MSRIICITGSGSKIAQAIIKKVAKNCDQLILHYRNNKPNITELNLPENIDIKFIQADFNDSISLENFCEQIKKCDLLINNATEVITDILPMLDDSAINKMLETNIVALIKICRAVIPYMSSKRKGDIINISSVSAHRANRGQTVYAGTKGFMESFSRALAAEFGGRGVRVNCVAPGPIDSDSLKDIMNYAPDEIKSSMLSKRLGTPEDVAGLVAYLASKEAEFINGESIKIDGAFIRGL